LYDKDLDGVIWTMPVARVGLVTAADYTLKYPALLNGKKFSKLTDPRRIFILLILYRWISLIPPLILLAVLLVAGEEWDHQLLSWVWRSPGTC
jgi:hypothetical protein